MKSKATLLIPIYVFSISCIFLSCKTPKEARVKTNDSKTAKNNSSTATYMARPPVLIYKTKEDFNDKVPIMLSADGKSIVSYPDIRDVYFGGELAYPTALANGYLLDNRGIGLNVAFMDYTYEQYSKLEQTPTPEELIKHIIEKDPLLELFSCVCVKDTNYLNQKISEGDLSPFKKLK
jgi:hypothetical protein